MKKIIFIAILCISIVTVASCQEKTYDPWGIWNSYPVDINTADIRKFRTGQYYEAGDSGIAIVQDCSERVAGNYHFPAFAVPGEYNKIENYEKTDYGFLFSLVGEGYKKNQVTGVPEFQDDTRIQIKMIFISPDECKFEYVSKVDKNGFRLSFLPDENVIYRRYKVK